MMLAQESMGCEQIVTKRGFGYDRHVSGCARQTHTLFGFQYESPPSKLRIPQAPPIICVAIVSMGIL